jgi:L-fucose isomerase-like protein
MIAIYTITSALHDEAVVKAVSDEFLQSVFPEGGYEMRGSDFSSFGLEADLNIIYIRTGGAEGIFKELLPDMLEAGVGYFTLLTSGKSNSLAASLEILSYLKQNGLKGEVLHGSPQYISRRISILEKVATARAALFGSTVGIIGKPSDWLISSTWDADVLFGQLGLSLVDIPMDDLIPAIGRPLDGLPGAEQIYNAVKNIVDERALKALTIRCFDLLTAVRNTGCYALAKLNSEGIPSSCEGDVPALLSMMVARALTGRTGFQANPARIDVESGEMLFAHCTIPFDLVDEFNYDTHFESGIGVGIHGHYPEGSVTVFKLSGALDRAFIAEGELFRNQYEANLCRTQVWLRLTPADARYFLTDPIGNHHIIIPGHHGELLHEFVRSL